MKCRPYSADLLIALQKTVRRVAESGDLTSDDPAIRKLKQSLVLKIAEQEMSESRKGNPKN
jgi:hypothetical protein